MKLNSNYNSIFIQCTLVLQNMEVLENQTTNYLNCKNLKKYQKQFGVITDALSMSVEFIKFSQLQKDDGNITITKSMKII